MVAMSSTANGPENPVQPESGTAGGLTGWERPAPAEAGSTPSGTPEGDNPWTYSAPANDPWGTSAPTQPAAYPSTTLPSASQPYASGPSSQDPSLPPYVPPMQPHVVAPYGAAPAPAPVKPSRLGLIGTVLAVSALVISVILSWLTGDALGHVLQITGTTTFNSDTIPPEALPHATRGTGLMLAQVIPSVLGLAGLICSAIGLGKPGPKTLAILGLVVAILAPMISFGVYIAGMAPYLPHR